MSPKAASVRDLLLSLLLRLVGVWLFDLLVVLRCADPFPVWLWCFDAGGVWFRVLRYRVLVADLQRLIFFQMLGRCLPDASCEALEVFPCFPVQILYSWCR